MFMGFSSGDEIINDEKESEFPLVDETRAMQQKSLMKVNHHHPHHHFENEADFSPVEHPMEPPDEDRPVKCPMPESSVINDGELHGRKFAESPRKRAEVSATVVDREKIAAMDAEPPARAVRKRHHTLTNGGPCDDPINENANPPSFRNPECHHLPNASAV